MLSGLWQRYVGTTSTDYEPTPLGKKAALAAGWTAATTGVGAAVGALRQAQDTVTISQVPVPETRSVQVGTTTVPGCWMPIFHGDGIVTYMPYCTEEVPVYAQEPTGRTLYQPVEHHSVGFPNTVWQGAALGLGFGLVTGVAALVASELVKR